MKFKHTPPKWRDQLKSAAHKFCEHPEHDLAFYAVCDRIISEAQEKAAQKQQIINEIQLGGSMAENTLSFNFGQVNWLVLGALILAVQQDYRATVAAVGVAEKAKAVGKFAEDVVSGVEALTGKDFANNAKVHSLVVDVINAIVDAGSLHP